MAAKAKARAGAAKRGQLWWRSARKVKVKKQQGAKGMAQHPLSADERLGKVVDLVCRIAEAHPPMSAEIAALVQELRGPERQEAKEAKTMADLKHPGGSDVREEGKRK